MKVDSYSIVLGSILLAFMPGAAMGEHVNPCKEYVDSGAYDAAIAVCTRQIDGKHTTEQLSVLYNHRGIAYGHKGMYSLEIRDYDMAIKLSPDYSHAYNNRGIAYVDIGRYDLAIADYMKAIALTPKHASAYYNMACLYSRRRDFVNACEWLKKAIVLGFHKRYVQGDHDLDNVRSSTCYQAIMKR